MTKLYRWLKGGTWFQVLDDSYMPGWHYWVKDPKGRVYIKTEHYTPWGVARVRSVIMGMLAACGFLLVLVGASTP